MFTWISNILIAAGVYMIFYSFLVLIQNVRINNAMVELEALGRVYMGRGKGILLTRTIMLIAVDKNEKIVKSKRVRATFIVIPCQTYDFDLFTGKYLLDLNLDAMDITDGVKRATLNLIDNFKTKKSKAIEKERQLKRIKSR